MIDGQEATSLSQFVRAHNVSNDGLRLGQRFVNIYISQPWPELFYETSDKEALLIITRWLTENHYMHTMPPLAKQR